jgi:hypothetical protein
VPAGLAGVKRPQVRVGKVRHVDVVPDAAAIGCGVVVAEYSDADAAGRRRREHVGDQMGLRGVPLAEPAAVGGLLRAGHVEVAQADRAEAVQPGRLGKRRVGLAVHRGGGRKDDPAGARQAHGVQQGQRAAEVVRPVLGRVRHRFAD